MNPQCPDSTACPRCMESHDPRTTCADGGSPKAKDRYPVHATPAAERSHDRWTDNKGNVNHSKYCWCLKPALPQPEPTAESAELERILRDFGASLFGGNDPDDVDELELRQARQTIEALLATAKAEGRREGAIAELSYVIYGSGPLGSGYEHVKKPSAKLRAQVRLAVLEGEISGK